MHQRLHGAKELSRRVSNSSNINEVNPKELVDKALPNAESLIVAAAISYLEMRMQIMEAAERDVVTVYSLPIFMLDDTADSLAAIKDIGRKVEKAEKKVFIMNTLNIVFLLSHSQVSRQVPSSAARRALLRLPSSSARQGMLPPPLLIL